MTRDFRIGLHDREDSGGDDPGGPAPGKVTLTQRLTPVQRRVGALASDSPLDGIAFLARPLQRKATRSHEDPFATHFIGPSGRGRDSDVHAAAAQGLEAPATTLPHVDRIQASFGRHDVSAVHAHLGAAASDASAAMGATAYATGNDIVFGGVPDLHTAAHEAAHVVQQRGGVQLKGGIGADGDRYEQHADAVADKVVRGESAEALLDLMAEGSRAATTVAVQRRRDDGSRHAPATSADVVGAAKDVSEAALAVMAFPGKADTALVRLDMALGALASALHEHAGERPPAEDRAIRTAVKDARRVADALSLKQGPHRAKELALQRQIKEINQLAFSDEGAARGPADLKPAELEVQAAKSLEQLEAARDLAVTMGIGSAVLDHATAKTEGWREALAAPDATTAEARRLSNAVFQQQEILFDLASELDDVVSKPSPSNYKVVEAYLVAMSKANERREVADEFVERARRARRAKPLARAETSLSADDKTTLQIAELDAKTGAAVRREYDATERQKTALAKTLAAGGTVSDYQIRKVEVDSREHAVLHNTQLFEVQGRQLVAVLTELMNGAANGLDEDLAYLLGYLRYEVEYFPVVRDHYHAKVEVAKDANDADRDGAWRTLRAREVALDELEALLQKRLTEARFVETLRRASKKAGSAQARAFALQLITTVALTLAGNVAASAARGAAEGAWVARAARAGATETEIAAVAARGELVFAGAGLAADVAVNTIGQKLQGDGASLLTLLTLNLMSPLILGKVQKNFVGLERVNASAARWKRAGDAVIHFAYDKLELSIEMIGGAAVDYASRILIAAEAHDPTEQEAESWLYQGAAMAVGRHLAVRSRTIATKLERIQTQTRRSMHDLIERSRALETDSATLAAGGDTPTANKLLAAYEMILSDKSAMGAEGGERSTQHDAPAAAKGDAADDSPASQPTSNLTWDGFRYVADAASLSADRDSWASSRPKDKVSKVKFDADANKMYFDVKSGKKRFRVEADMPPRIQSAAELLSTNNRIIGTSIKSEAVGHQILRDLNAGRWEALAKLGIEVPHGTKLPDGTEFGLGATPDGKFVVIRGEFNGVTWGQVPGVTPLAHTHPSTRGNDLGPLTGSDRVPLASLLESTDAPMMAREVIFPSPSDIRIMARLGIDGHRVISPFVVHDGHVMKPKAGDRAPPLEWVIGKPREVGRTPDGHVVFEWTVVGEVNGKAVTPPRQVWSAEPPNVQSAPPGARIKDYGSHYLSPPEMQPRGTQPSGSPTSGSTTRSSTVGGSGHGADPDHVKLTAELGAASLARLTVGSEGISDRDITSLIATHGKDAVKWAGETLDGTNATRVLASVNPATLAGLRDVGAADALKNVEVFGKQTIEASIPPMTGQRFNIEREHLGENAAQGVANQKVLKGKASELAHHADNLEAATATPHAPLASGSLIIDTNVLSGIKELMAGLAWKDLQGLKKTGINYLRQRANPKLDRLEGDPPSRDLESIIGKGHDLRAANNTLGESAPMAGLDRKGFELSISRDSAQYNHVLEELAKTPAPVGEAGGVGDRAIVADAMFANGSPNPRLMTGDRRIIDPLFKKYGPGKTTPIKQKQGQSVTKAIAEEYSAGFDVEIPDGIGGTKKLTIIPMVAE